MTYTTGPWTSKDWSTTGPTAAAGYVAQNAINAFNEGDRVRQSYTAIVAQQKDIGTKCICTVHGETQEEADANARLLAQAPAMLALLKITEELVRLVNDPTLNTALNNILESV